MRPLAGVATGLGVGLEGAEPTALYLEVCNVGAIPVEWRLLLRNEPEVDLENWVEIGEPASEVDAHQRFVLEQKIISVSPKFGALEPGQRQPVRVLYRHDHPGAHWLTALLSIKDGRSVRLELGGRTVPLETRCLDFGPANPSVAVHTLRPVVIGDLEPPAQTVELRNPSAAEVRYAIDLTKVEDLNADAWDFPVLTCVERAGTIPAFGTALVNFVFQPVEEKTYECEIGVSLEGGETSSLTIRGAGVLPEEFGGRPVEPDLLGDVARNTGEWIGYAPEPTLPPVGDFQLSSHACVFGDVPALSVTRRVVLLRSQSEADYDFVWDLGPFASDGVDGELVVEPASGRLDRGETVVCKVTFRARDKPQVFDGRVLCLLTPVSPSKEERAEEARLAEEELHAPEVFAEHSSQVWPSMPTRRELEGERRFGVKSPRTERSRNACPSCTPPRCPAPRDGPSSPSPARGTTPRPSRRFPRPLETRSWRSPSRVASFPIRNFARSEATTSTLGISSPRSDRTRPRMPPRPGRSRTTRCRRSSRACCTTR